MTEIRIAWKVGQASGHGEWFHTDNREYYLRVIENDCKEDGEGTHWLEERDKYSMTRKDAQNFFREHSKFWGNNMEDKAYKFHFDEAVEAIMNDDPLVPIPCPFCGGTDIIIKECNDSRWRIAECNKCGAKCGEDVKLSRPIEMNASIYRWKEVEAEVIAE